MVRYSEILRQLEACEAPDKSLDRLISVTLTGGRMDLPFTSSLHSANAIIEEYVPGLVLNDIQTQAGTTVIRDAWCSAVFGGEEFVVATVDDPIIASEAVARLIAVFRVMSKAEVIQDVGA